MFQEDIENIKSLIYKNLKPLIRKSEDVVYVYRFLSVSLYICAITLC